MVLKIVYGCPCSGKSTFVRSHAGEDDLIFDYDALITACTTRTEHLASRHTAHNVILKLRKEFVYLADHDSAIKTLWMMCRWPTDYIHEISAGITTEEIFVEATKEECLARLMKDDSRPDKEEWKQIIEDWFAEHQDPKKKGFSMNEIKKSYNSTELEKADARKDIDLINRYTLREMKPEEVFAFNINLCDTQVDRDHEAFNVKSLQKLAELFPGKPLIQDHEWLAKNQQGRIYRCQVVQEGSIYRLRASVYMIRTPGTEETIKQIEGGILREVSVGFNIRRLTCSICGEKMERSLYAPTKCINDHVKGQKYDGKLCVGIMEDPCDAMEVSFVAVPSQREAGVTKGHGNKPDLPIKELAKRKKIVEKAYGINISDDIWEAVIQGKIASSEMVDLCQKLKDKKPKYFPDIKPEDDDCYDGIKFVLLPDKVIPNEVMSSVFKALGFCRKELRLPLISVKWFSTVSHAQKMGLDTSKLYTFRQRSTTIGLSSPSNVTQILLRYPLDSSNIVADRIKTVFHECWHILQYTMPLPEVDESAWEYAPDTEESAYAYQEDAYRRYSALSKEEKEKLYYDEILMKDYSK